jgi:hypothetical protein
MKPIYFSSYGGYRRFCASWWNELLRYTTGITFSGWLYYREIKARPVQWGVPGWCDDIYTFYHRGRYGWAPRDVWNLDHYLNRVLGCTLAHLAETTHGAPSGYGSKDPMETNHDKWEADLRAWSAAFLDLHAWDDGGDTEAYDTMSPRDRWKMEQDKHKKVEKALKALAPWWGGLWD